MDLELKLKRLRQRMKEYEEIMENEGLGIFCQKCGDFILNDEITYGCEICEDCLEKEDQLREWRKSRI